MSPARTTRLLEPASQTLPLRRWLGVMLLAGSWLPGLGFYQPASFAAWLVLVVAGAIMIAGIALRVPRRAEAIVALLLLLPILWIAPWPAKIAPILLAIGCLLLAANTSGHRLACTAAGLLASGAILLAQALTMLAYQSITSRSHELPVPIARVLGWVVRVLGNDATVAADTPAGGGGDEIALRTMRKIHHLGATWDLLLDPTTLCFVVGAVIMLAFRLSVSRIDGFDWRRAGRAAAVLAGIVILWLPLRVGLLTALILHRALRTEFESPLRVMDAFHNAWVLLIFVLPPAVAAWRFISVPPVTEREPDPRRGSATRFGAILLPTLVAVAVAVLTVAALYDPIGIRKAGRVVVDEYHSKWEPTTRPYDTTWYGHESGYNYACIYDYSSRYYTMSRLEHPIDDQVLGNCDVFVLKCPTRRLNVDEVERLQNFVANGGGLLLVGEHTDVFGLDTNLNDVAQPFGFQFRYDILYNIDDEHPFDYLYQKPLVPHPIVQYMPPLDFEGPCTIQPTGGSSGRAVMTAVGQRNEPAYYNASNFMPPPDDRADSRYGAWILLWATKFGDGRVVAHADSTQWSNFSAFEPGKPEVWLGMIEWLNHRNGRIADPRMFLIALGALVLIAAVVVAVWQAGTNWLVTLAAGSAAFAFTAPAVRAVHRNGMPPPPRLTGASARPMINVGIDRGVSDAILSKGGFIGGRPDGFGIFERWILRLGWFTQRGGAGDSAFYAGKDLVVFFMPGKDVSEDVRTRLADYVRNGGRALVIDSPEFEETSPPRKSTANSLLHPFGLELRRPYAPISGDVVSTIGLPTVQNPASFEVAGGHEVLATMAGRPVAATVHFGRGTVTAVGFGSRFADANMGVTGDVVPGDELSKVYELQYGLLRHIVGQATPAPTTQPTSNPTTRNTN